MKECVLMISATTMVTNEVRGLGDHLTKTDGVTTSNPKMPGSLMIDEMITVMVLEEVKKIHVKNIVDGGMATCNNKVDQIDMKMTEGVK